MTDMPFAYLAITRSGFDAIVSKKAGLRSGEVSKWLTLDRSENVDGENFGAQGIVFGSSFNAVYEDAAQEDDMVVLRISLACAVETRAGFVDLEVTGSGADNQAPYEYVALVGRGDEPFTVPAHAISYLDRSMRDFKRLSYAFIFDAPKAAAPKKARSPKQLAAIRANYARKRALAA